MGAKPIRVSYNNRIIKDSVNIFSLHLNSLRAGKYVVTITDKNNCSYTDSITLSQPPALTGSISYYNKFNDTYSDSMPYHNYAIACHGTNTKVKANGKGGISPYQYNWYDVDDTTNYGNDTISTKVAGSYVVKIRDLNGCITQIDYVLTEPDSLRIIGVLPDTVNCYYSSDGSIAVTVEGGVSNVASCTYMLTDSILRSADTIINQNKRAFFNNLSGSIYSIKIRDDNQCSVVADNIDIRNLDTLRVSVAHSIMPSCFGGNDGRLTLVSHIINNPSYNDLYSYTVMRSNNNSLENIISNVKAGDTLSVDNLYAGTYFIRISDAIGCMDSISFSLPQPPRMELEIDTIIPNRCFNDNTATLRLIARGGVGGYKFAYAYDTVNVDFPSAPNDTTSVLELNNLNWNKNNTDIPLTYIVKLKDHNYKATQAVCLITESILLPRVERITYAIINFPPTCYNDSNGKLFVTNINGGKGNISSWQFSWKDADGKQISSKDSATNLSAGTYSLVVSDSLGCTVTENEIVLQNPPRFEALRQSLYLGCDSTHNVSYQLQNIDSASYDVIHNSFRFTKHYDDEAIFAIDTGINVFTFVNWRGCSTTDSFVMYYPEPHIDSVSVLDASIGGVNNGMAFVFSRCGNGNNQYIWTFPNGSEQRTTVPRIKNLPAGNYTVRVMDGKEFVSSSFPFTVNEVNRISIAIDSIRPATCERAKNGFVSVAVNSPNPVKEINWKDSYGNIVGQGYELSQIPAGDYIVEVVDTSANIGRSTISVSSRKKIAINSIETSPVSCHGGNDGRAMVKANGGSGRYSYLWNNGDSTDRLLNVTKGIYQVRVTDMEDSLCYATASVTISEPDPLQILLSSYKKPTCYGGNDGELSVKAIGGNGSYEYQWEDSVLGNLHKGLSPGNYRVMVKDKKECKSDTAFTLPNTIPIEIETLSLTMPLCYGSSDGSIKLSLKGGKPEYMVYWPDLNNTIGTYKTQLKAGKYRIEAHDGNGCVFRDTIVLGQPAKLLVDSITYNQPSCSYTSNGSIRVFPSGGTPPYRFKINNQLYSNSQISDLKQGNYQVFVYDNNNCTASQNVSILAPLPVNYTYTTNMPSCNGYSNGKITVIPSGGTPPYKVFLDNILKSAEISSLGAGKYEVMVKDSNNCAASKIITIQQPDQLSIQILDTKQNPCYGDCKAEMRAVASGGSGQYTYTWNDRTLDSVKRNACAGNYTVEVKDINNCMFRVVHSVSQPKAIVRDSLIIVDPTCFEGKDGRIWVNYKGGTGNLNYAWKHGNKGNEATGLASGIYYLTVKDENNCSKSDTFVVNNTPKENIKNVIPYYKLCEGQVMPLWPGLWRNYLWYLDNKLIHTDDTLWINAPGKYAVKVVSFKGCEDSLNFTVEYTTQLIKANFLLSHQAVAGEDVQIIDVSWPIPEKIYWEYNTDSIELINNSDDRQTVRFKYPGEYMVKLKTTAYSCIDSVTKRVVVYESYDDLEHGKMPHEENSDILELRLYPNPNNGTFTLYIKLIDQQNVIVEILSTSAGYSIYRNELKGSDNYNTTIGLSGQPSGVYTLKITTRRQVKFIHFILI